MNIQPEFIVESLGQLPALRPVVVKLLASFDDPRIDTQSLVHEIAEDQALCVRVLRLANSSFYGLPTHVDALREAVMILGFRTVRAVTVAVSLTECFSARPLAGIDPLAFWRHCAAVGMASREIAAITHRQADVAFTAGVIHDIGLLALLWLYPQAMAGAMANCRDQRVGVVVGEREALGVDHPQVGALLAARWGLPAVLAEAIRYHEQPDDATADSLADVVHVANGIVQQYGLPELAGLPPASISDLAMNRLGLGTPEVHRIVERLDADLDVTFQALFG
jgi:HD-like signal output (HDOD) protein